jgi:hypothetical protein
LKHIADRLGCGILAFTTGTSTHSFFTAHDCPPLPISGNISQITLVQGKRFEKSAQLISENRNLFLPIVAGSLDVTL